MKKSDLKPGMVVEYANGERRLVIEFNEELYLLNNDSCDYLTNYTADLECFYNKDFTIDKVCKPWDMRGLDSILTSKYSYIWERPKSVELTMEDIAEKFGIKVTQLKIKK